MYLKFLNVSLINIWIETQYGFRKNLSTIDDVVGDMFDSIVGDERRRGAGGGLVDREHVLSVFLYLFKELGCVQHANLMHKLELCGVYPLRG